MATDGVLKRQSEGCKQPRSHQPCWMGIQRIPINASCFLGVSSFGQETET